MYNSIEQSNSYSKKSGSLCQYYKNDPGKADNSPITDSK